MKLQKYPFLDGRSQSESYKKYTDTPVWNSTLSKQVGTFTDPNPEDEVPLFMTSPVEAEFHDTEGTMHGFDYMTKAPTTMLMELLRTEYMKKKFRGE